MSIDEYPIIDFSEIPGCESPIVPRSSVRFLSKDYEKPNRKSDKKLNYTHELDSN